LIPSETEIPSAAVAGAAADFASPAKTRLRRSAAATDAAVAVQRATGCATGCATAAAFAAAAVVAFAAASFAEDETYSVSENRR